MMELIGRWLLGVVGTMILIAVADSLMPSGSVKQVGKLVFGMILMLIIVKPGVELSPESWVQVCALWETAYKAEDMEKIYNEQMKMSIEQQLATYIVDKAREQGIWCNPVVTCEVGADQIFRPIQVTFSEVSESQRPFLIHLVQTDLGILETEILFKEGEE